MRSRIPDINDMTQEELARIPGIGRETAEAIIEYRDDVGGLRSFEELMNVEGITQHDIDRLKSWLQINESVEES